VFSVQPAPYYCESDFSFDSYGLSNLDIWSNQPIYFIFGQIKPPQNDLVRNKVGSKFDRMLNLRDHELLLSFGN
jgi:hypothetical protein